LVVDTPLYVPGSPKCQSNIEIKVVPIQLIRPVFTSNTSKIKTSHPSGPERNKRAKKEVSFGSKRLYKFALVANGWKKSSQVLTLKAVDRGRQLECQRMTKLASQKDSLRQVNLSLMRNSLRLIDNSIEFEPNQKTD